MSMNETRSYSYAGAFDRATFDAGLRAHMLRIYNLMAGGVALTGALAWIVANTSLAKLIFGTPLQYVLMFAPFGLMMYMGMKLHAMSATKVQTLFWVFCGLMGLSMGSIFLVFTGEAVARAFFATAATFGVMSLYGYTTKRDLSAMGAFMMMGVMGIVVASLVNVVLALMSMPSSMLQWIISVVGVVVFTGLTAWDTQRIKQTYAEHYGAEENNKLAVWNALQLYLNFINLFTFMLQLMGGRRE